MFKKFLAVALLVATMLIAGCTTTPQKRYWDDPIPGLIVISGGISEMDFKSFYNQTLDPSIRKYHIVISTDGGCGYTTTGIVSRMQELKDRGVHITTEVYTKGFSAGSFMFMMGDTRIMHEGAQLMWHTIVGQQVITNGRDMPRKFALTAVPVDENIIRLASKNLPLVDPMTLETMLRWSGETFMTAREAFELGIATHFVGT